jgi:hypothetical protein
MLSEREAFARMRKGTLSKTDCELYIEYYMDMKPVWLANGDTDAYRRAWRKDAKMTKYFIDTFIPKIS